MPRCYALIMLLVPRLLSLVTLFALIGCGERSDGGGAGGVREALPELNVVSPELPAVEAPLSRRDILLAVAEAASSFGSGADGGSTESPALAGRTFAFRLRYCEQSGPNHQSTLDANTGVLKVEVRRDIDRETAAVQQMVESAGVEDVEGFWVPRPWLLEAACPRSAPPAEQEPAGQSGEPAQTEEAPVDGAVPLPTVGIVEFHSGERARSARREQRPYRLTKTLGEGTQPGPIDLVLQGRLQRAPGGQVITCMGDAVTGPPTCIVSVRIDQVRMEAASGELLAEWSKA